MAKPRCRTAIPIATLARQKMLSTKKRNTQGRAAHANLVACTKHARRRGEGVHPTGSVLVGNCLAGRRSCR